MIADVATRPLSAQPLRPTLTDDELAEVARRFEGAEPLALLTWAAETFAPTLGFATGFGPEGGVLIDLIGRHRLPIEIFTIDTGVLFPETYTLWGQLEARYQLTIRGVHPVASLARQAAAEGEALWTREPDRCCQLRKLEPLQREAQRLSAWIAAIRHDQTPERAAARPVERDRRFGLIKLNPLLHWTSAQVWRYLVENEVPYNALHDQGYPSIGCSTCTSPVAAGEDPRAGRWRGQGKRECGLHLPIVDNRGENI